MKSMQYFKEGVMQSEQPVQSVQPTLSSTLNRKAKQYSKEYSKRFKRSETPDERYEKLQTKELGYPVHRNFQRKRYGSSSKGRNPELDNSKLEQIQLRKRMQNDKVKINLAKKNTQENPIVIDGVPYEIDYDDKRFRDVLQNLFIRRNGVQYEWFKEERGYKHWVLYRTDQFEVKTVETSSIFYLNTCKSKLVPTHFRYLHYRGDNSEDVEFPVNVTTCFLMFSGIRFKKKSNIRITPEEEQNISQDAINTSKQIDKSSSTSLQNGSTPQFYKSSNAKVIDFVGTFAGAKFEVHSHFPKDFSTENAVKMDGMFYNAELLGDVNLPEDFSTENVVSMEYMFSRAFLGEGVKFSKGFSTENVFTMEGMFYACSLSSNPFSEELGNNNFFNTKNVIDMSEMFNAAHTMTKNFKLPIGFNLNSIDYSKHMFYGGSLGIQFYIKDKTNTQIVDILKECGSQGKPVDEAL